MNTTIRDRTRKNEVITEYSLGEAASWKPYSKELKLAAIYDYLSDKYNVREVMKKRY
ncbi:hypothetical protein K0H71_20475 [Bacillus sp. IITD106]|nr:hypothetical protein [Bacillus sp. IITD106]